jgi:hypothetical protein
MRVIGIISNRTFSDWATRQHGDITASRIQDAHLWNRTALCKQMAWDPSVLDVECGPLGFTVADIILPRLFERMATLWQIETPRQYTHGGITHRHEHEITLQFPPARLREAHPPPSHLRWLLGSGWDIWVQWVWDGTWNARAVCGLLIVISLRLLSEWCWKPLFLTWRAFWTIYNWIAWALASMKSSWNYVSALGSRTSISSSIPTPSSPSRTESPSASHSSPPPKLGTPWSWYMFVIFIVLVSLAILVWLCSKCFPRGETRSLGT